MTPQKMSWSDRDQFEDDSVTENEEDIRVVDQDFEQLLIAPSDWTVSTIYELIGKQLQLDPAYQRRNVWQVKAKSQFIESLLLGIPIPQILLASRAGQKNSFLVLDGKQRLNAIKEFIDGHYSDGKVFRLKGLRILKSLENKTWADLEGDEDWSDRLRNEPLRTTVLRGWKNESVLYEIFYRLNSGSVKLSPMELRMSLLPGDFLKFIISWTESIGPIHHLLRKREPDARMSDVELAIRYLAFRDQKVEYAGDLKLFLDEFCGYKNSEFSADAHKENECRSLLNQMDEAINLGLAEFGERDFCRKYLNGNYEIRFNRAIFDVLVGALSFHDVRVWVENNPGAMKNLYERVCEKNIDFVKSVEVTTKSPEATRTRFSTWYNEVSRESGVKIKIPDIK
ncbi:GmrSD restriction endonuclease domain-containing protein [Castellaniella sp. WN]